MSLNLDLVRKKLGLEPRKIGFFGWGNKWIPIPKELKSYGPSDEPLLDTLYRQKDIWRKGKVVLGYVVMANRALYFPGKTDLPGEVLYSLSATDAEAEQKLPHIAEALYDAKVADQELTDFPQDQRGIIEHLRAEKERGFGLAVPPAMSSGMECHVSTFWGHRPFLPEGCVSKGFLPLLVLAGKVHDVLILPAPYWPSDLLVPWCLRVNERTMRKKMSEDRIAASLARNDLAKKSPPPLPWREATVERLMGSWAWETEFEQMRAEDDTLGSHRVRSVWTFDAEQRCWLKIEGRLLINGEELEDAPKFEHEYAGTFELEAGSVTATLPEHEDSPLKLTVLATGEIVNEQRAVFCRTTPPPLEEVTTGVSEGGSTLYHYKPRAPGIVPPDMTDSNLEAISQHIEEHIGPIENVWHELVSDIVHIDVHVVAPRPERPYYTLVTSGMSDLRMKAPEGAEYWSYGELMICLPPSWKMDQDAFKDERHYWPIRWLKTLARLPHEYGTWLSHHHTIPNGDPAEPLAKDSPFTGFMLVEPMTTSVDFHELMVPPQQVIHFYAVLPLTSDEMSFKLQCGAAALCERLSKRKVTELVNPNRRSVLD